MNKSDDIPSVPMLVPRKSTLNIKTDSLKNTSWKILILLTHKNLRNLGIAIVNLDDYGQFRPVKMPLWPIRFCIRLTLHHKIFFPGKNEHPEAKLTTIFPWVQSKI